MHFIKSPTFHHSYHTFYSLYQILPPLTSIYYTSNLYPITPPKCPTYASLPYFPPSTTQSSNSRYAFSKSSFVTTTSCTSSSFANSISASACASLFCKLSSFSVPRPRNRCSRTSRLGGERKRKRALRSVRLTCLTPCNCEEEVALVLRIFAVVAAAKTEVCEYIPNA